MPTIKKPKIKASVTTDVTTNRTVFVIIFFSEKITQKIKNSPIKGKTKNVSTKEILIIECLTNTMHISIIIVITKLNRNEAILRDFNNLIFSITNLFSLFFAFIITQKEKNSSFSIHGTPSSH